MRQLINRTESRHRAESVLGRQFGQQAVGVTRQSLAQDLLFALDELDEREELLEGLRKSFGAWAIGESDKRIAKLETALEKIADTDVDSPAWAIAAKALRGES